jgi:hypothetical protein
MKHFYTFIGGVVIGLVIMYFASQDTDHTDIEILKDHNSVLRDSISAFETRYQNAIKLVEESKKYHIPDTIYKQINKYHETYIDSIILLDADGTVSELSRWITEADTLRRRHAYID